MRELVLTAYERYSFAGTGVDASTGFPLPQWSKI
jgi:hypothetical protein